MADKKRKMEKKLILRNGKEVTAVKYEGDFNWVVEGEE